MKAETALFRITIGLCTGIFFGIALQKGRVFEPKIIIDQYTFQSFQMLKFFLAAAGTSAWIIALMHKLKIESAKDARSYVFLPEARGISSSLIGGTVLGMGMAVSGACPGTIAVQLGLGQSFLALPGAFVGTWIFFYLEPNMRWFMPRGTKIPPTWDKALRIPYIRAAIIVAGLFYSVVLALEVVHPYTLDIPAGATRLTLENAFTSNWLTVYAWPPYLSGFVIALVTIPLIIALKDGLGASSSMAAFFALVAYHVDRRFFNRRPCLQGMFQMCWQTAFIFSAALAGHFLSRWDGSFYNEFQSVSSIRLFVGAALVYFGARLAAGCTSGNGVSGNGFLAIPAFFATCGMLGGAIITTMFLPYPF